MYVLSTDKSISIHVLNSDVRDPWGVSLSVHTNINSYLRVVQYIYVYIQVLSEIREGNRKSKLFIII